MCGIAGFLDLGQSTGPDRLDATARAMAATLVHRGPDDGGVWSDAGAGLALGFRRLSIIDLSQAGHQPMVSADGRFVLVYNGEIYDHMDLRPDLEKAGCAFRGHCDSETLLEACARWGVERTLARINGMFALALWDRETRTLTLARDRMGIKPLYWGLVGGLFLFGSEIKALRAHPGWTPEVDRDALAAYVHHKYVPTPHSIYKGVHKLPPGHVLSFTPGQEPRIGAYWDARAIRRAATADRLDIGAEEAARGLEELLLDAVARRMVADVPLGAFLSGGIDSATVVALMQAQSSRPVRTFTIGFGEPDYDEAPHARAVAKHLGTDHTELYVAPERALEIIPTLPERYDEPFADSSQIPTLLVAEMAREHVTVALTGDGGDEIFGGYKRYFLAQRVWRALGWMPPPARRGLTGALRALPALCQAVKGMRPGRGPGFPCHDLNRVADVVAQPDRDALHRLLLTSWIDPGPLVLGADEPRGILWDPSVARDVPDYMERMGYLDALTYLPDDILTKVDRASMAVSLEARVPLLDHRVAELAWRLPPAVKYGGGESKPLLRRVLRKYVPAGLMERPKMGFRMPVKQWLRGALRPWAEELLDERRLREEGFFDAAGVRAIWDGHQSGRRSGQQLLWRILMFQAWHAHQADSGRANAPARPAA